MLYWDEQAIFASSHERNIQHDTYRINKNWAIWLLHFNWLHPDKKEPFICVRCLEDVQTPFSGLVVQRQYLHKWLSTVDTEHCHQRVKDNFGLTKKIQNSVNNIFTLFISLRVELIPVSLAWSTKEYFPTSPGWDASLLQGNPPSTEFAKTHL